MRNAVLSLVLIALPAGAVVAEPRQFDLNCTGTVKTVATGDVQPLNQRLSIDLDAMVYCEQPCSTPEPIAAVQPDRLLLRWPDPLHPDHDAEAAALVNRFTGRYRASDYGTAHVYDAVCAVAPFSGLKAKLF